ncbi:MAG TPA: beta-galactosidase [Candidatus Sulfotelmatobacter sp.]|nr:beta-galactosidase [Candidatus Sulfotelmatobacter sp.]
MSLNLSLRRISCSAAIGFILAVLTISPPNAWAQSNTNSTAIRWDRQTFTIGGKDVILIGGSMHYFRIPEAEWDADFERMQEDGFNITDVYIPWFIHEPEEGKFDFASLEKFLSLAHKHGIYVVARPGPYINSESDQGAFPRWLSGKHVGFRRNTELDRKWSKHWYDAIMPVLARNQVTRGGPVIMVQIENEYGHPQYISDDEKKEFVRFLFQAASEYKFDVPLMGNDMQFAQKDPNDPILSKIYGTVDAYFGSYENLEEMLTNQRKLNTNSPLGCAEYGLAGAEATVRTMLGLGTNYLDEYLFRGGSQFRYAAKGYEFAGYSADAIVEEGGYTMPKYGPMKTAALFLRQFGPVVARAEPAPEPATVDDPEVWIRQRNHGEQGFLFVRSDMRGVSERTLALQSTSEQHISYVDPASHQKRTIPQYTHLLLRREQTRLLALNLPISKESKLLYSTSDLLGLYSDPDRTWLVFYGDPGEIGEASVQFDRKPGDLNEQAIWTDSERAATFVLPFGESDQIVPVSGKLSLLLISRERAYREKNFSIDGESSLLISNADDALVKPSSQQVEIDLQSRHPLGEFTFLGPRLSGVISGGKPIPVKLVGGAQQFSAALRVPAPSLLDLKVAAAKSWTGFHPSIAKNTSRLVSLPELGIWDKGITHYRASFPTQDAMLRLKFFTDDFKAVYVNGKFIPEASNRSIEDVVLTPCTGQTSCNLDIYYVDTGRPKEDLGLWRLDEKKGLSSVDWLKGTQAEPVQAEWNVDFAGLSDLKDAPSGESAMTTLQYSFHRPDSSDLTAVWRAFMPDIRGLVYLNGVYVEHHEPGRTLNIGRDGIYLPPSMLRENNTLQFVTYEPVPAELPPVIIRAEPDSIRKEIPIGLRFADAPKR